MDDTASKFDKQNMERTYTLISIEDSKIKCNDYNYTLEISENEEESNNKECKVNINHKKVNSNEFENGEIIVTSFLDFEGHEYLQGVKINLYKINGLSPILIKSKITDKDGNVVFSELEEGCYRIIEIIDKKYFEKPKYINWNEIIIDSINKKEKIIVVNKIKKLIDKDKHKQWI